MNIKQKFKKIKRRFIRNKKCLDGRWVKPGKVNLEWWQQKENVGDAISPIICEFMLSKRNLSFESRAKRTCHMMAVGSVCGAGQVDATVWGSGIHHEQLKGNILRNKSYVKLDIRAVRGPVTEKFLNENGISCPKIYGDPAIIMPLIYRPGEGVSKVYPVSVVKHISVKDAAVPDNVHSIDIETNDYKGFIDEILRSEKVISSSLHGIILSESYGVPAVFLCEGMEDQMMKYADWYESTGRSDFRCAKSIEEALDIEPMPLPELGEMRERLMAAFPYDLWK